MFDFSVVCCVCRSAMSSLHFFMDSSMLAISPCGFRTRWKENVPSVSPVLGVSQNDAIPAQRSRISLPIPFHRIPRSLDVFSGGLEE